MSGFPIWHPFTQHGLGEPITAIASARDAVLTTADGRTIIDAISSWWVITHGHCHPRIVAAIQAQAATLDQVIFAGYSHEPAEALAATLIDILPAPLAHVFFSDSGSTAVEVALKMALGYWHNRGEKRERILVMEHSYHGDTIGAMSVGARGVFTASYAPMLFDVGTIPFPAAKQEQATLDALESACKSGDVAAFIVEPLVLGAGGMLMYPAHILAEMRAICARYDVLFIADEVMTGWGRTGGILACEQAGVVPDILCMAKGLTGGSIPLAVTVATSALFDAHYSTDRARQFFHSSSFTANPIACAAANANLALWRDEPVRQRIADLTAWQAEGGAMLSGVDGIMRVRQCGTIIAFDVDTGDGGYLSNVAPRLLAWFRANDLLLRPLGNTVYAMPPYGITRAQLRRVHEGMAEAVRALR